MISIRDGNFTWDWESYNLTKEDETKKLNIFRPTLKDINLNIRRGELIGIIGEVGSGKSSLLQAILNNLKAISPEPKVILNGSVSYVAQIPWIQNATLKNNILYGNEYNELKYRKVIELSELSQDLKTLVAGDMTEIGEKGLNLSGGQKARVSLARALYSDTEIYLLDDIIAALDSYVGDKIMKNCILGCLKDKTRILVTHALNFLHLVDRISLYEQWANYMDW